MAAIIRSIQQDHHFLTVGLVAIASILSMRPEILTLDEPTAELDPRGVKRIFELVRRLPLRRTDRAPHLPLHRSLRRGGRLCPP